MRVEWLELMWKSVGVECMGVACERVWECGCVEWVEFV